MYVPLLSLVMNFLWLVYRKYKYKYTMIRWTIYIVMRSVAVTILIQLTYYHMSTEYDILDDMLVYVITMCLYIFDFIQYVYYSKRFYSHLKSREKEIRLFYFDKEAYIRSRGIRIHFLICNILVINALFLYTLGYFVLYILHLLELTLEVFHFRSSILDNATALSWDNVGYPMIVLSKVLLNINYLYIIIVIIYKSIRSRFKLYNINKHIKPIVKVYHDSVYYRY